MIGLLVDFVVAIVVGIAWSGLLGWGLLSELLSVPKRDTDETPPALKETNLFVRDLFVPRA